MDEGASPLEHELAVQVALADADFRRVAQVRASSRVYDIVAARPDVGVVLVRCVLNPISRDTEEAAEMVAAGDFDAAVVAYKNPPTKKIEHGPSVTACSLDDLSDVLQRLRK
jgi:hypothetical protein